MRVVLDTNVLLPALFAPGLCEALLDLLLETPGCTLVLSEHILDECREHAASKFGVPAKDLNETLSLVASMADVVKPAKVAESLCRDADDLPILGTAVAGRADVLVTGDRELLALGHVEGIPIITPRAFFEYARGEG